MNKIIPAKRTQNIRHATRDVVPIAKEVEKSGKKVLYLNIGDPMVYDFRTPEHMWQAIFDNKKKAEGYTDSLGTAGARRARAAHPPSKGAPKVSQKDVI